VNIGSWWREGHPLGLFPYGSQPLLQVNDLPAQICDLLFRGKRSDGWGISRGAFLFELGKVLA